MGETVFTEDGDTGLAAVGTRTADITSVNGQPAVNNAGDGTVRTRTDSTNGGTAVANARPDGTLDLVVDLDAANEGVVPVVYRNGGPVNADADGGRSPRLELNDDGTPSEAFDVGGVFGEFLQVPDPGVESFRAAIPNPDTVQADDVFYEITGLVPGQEYRVTVLGTGAFRADERGETVFAEDGDSGLASVGERRSADLRTIDGQPAVNNTGDRTATAPNDPANSGTAVFVAAADGTATVVLDADQRNEAVNLVVYRNGGPGNQVTDGGSSPRLELNDDGTPKEVFALSEELITT
jgi:hypothetical protein